MKISVRTFTLVEMLVVIAIISILASMMLPSLGNAISSAKAISCMTNLSGVGKAMMIYAGDYNGNVILRWKAGDNATGAWLGFYGQYMYNNQNYNKGYLDSASALCPAVAPYHFDLDKYSNNTLLYTYAANITYTTFGDALVTAGIPNLSDLTGYICIKLQKVSKVEKSNHYRLPLLTESRTTTDDVQQCYISRNSGTYQLNLCHNARANTLFSDLTVLPCASYDFSQMTFSKGFIGGEYYSSW